MSIIDFSKNNVLASLWLKQGKITLIVCMAFRVISRWSSTLIAYVRNILAIANNFLFSVKTEVFRYEKCSNQMECQ